MAAIAADADPPPGADDREPRLQINCRRDIETKGPSSQVSTRYLQVHKWTENINTSITQ